MATRTRKKVTATESIEDLVEKHDNTDEPVLKEIELIEPQVELKENEIKEQKKLDLIIPKPIHWKKIGSGGFLFNNRYIKPGQIFTATVEEIPLAFRDLIVPVDKLPDDPFKKPKKVVNYSLVQTEDGKWNIVDKLGKVFNDSPMELNEAEKVLNVL